MRLLMTLSFLGLPLLFAACPDSSGGDVEERAALGAACVLNTDCEIGLLCEGAVCVDPSSLDNNSSHEDGGQSSPTGPTNDSGNSTPSGVVEIDSGTSSSGNNPFASNTRPWLLSVDNGSNELIKIDVETGAHRGICSMASSGFYVSTTFGINGVLYASKLENDVLEIIDPCTCETTLIGSTGFGLIPGITANGVKEETIYGLETEEDLLLDLDVETGAGSVVGGTMTDFQLSGTTWSDDLPGLFAINNIDDTLYTLDTETGVAYVVAELDTEFNYVGIEWNPYNRKLYACTTLSSGLGHGSLDANPGSNNGLSVLYEVNPEDGTTRLINDLPHACNNLAAPWTAVACVDDLEVVTPDLLDAGTGDQQ